MGMQKTDFQVVPRVSPGNPEPLCPLSYSTGARSWELRPTTGLHNQSKVNG